MSVDDWGLELRWESEKVSLRKCYFTCNLRPKTCVGVVDGGGLEKKSIFWGRRNECEKYV